MLKKVSALCLLLAVMATAFSQQPQKRIALVIGVQHYANIAPLRLSLNDANDIATSLKLKGFQVEFLKDPKSKSEINDAIKRYFNIMKDLNGAVGIIYYAGHGIYSEGKNYLIPASATLQVPGDMNEQCVEMNSLILSLAALNKNTNILLLEAPHVTSFGPFSGEIGDGSIFFLATQPGTTVAEGTGNNSLFTSKLLKYINEPGLDIDNIMKKVSRDVKAESQNKQLPTFYINAVGYENFYFTPNTSTPNYVAKNATVENNQSSSTMQRGEELRFDNNNFIKPTGEYFALLIGVSKYENAALNLNKPIIDARKFGEILSKKYSFKNSNIITLENPSRHDIIKTLYGLRKLTPNDNLLIFYAGHGFYDEKIKQGYWWPKDALSSDPSNWLSNSEIKEQIKGISTAHTLLITDACFGGSILRDANGIKDASVGIINLYKLPSRQVMSSTTLKAVPDESQFLYYLLKRLEENEEPFLPASQLYSSFKIAVSNNSKSVPQFQAIQDVGDEGGDFIFIKKN